VNMSEDLVKGKERLWLE